MIEKRRAGRGRAEKADGLENTLKMKLKDPAIDRLAAAANERRPLEYLEYRRYLAGFIMVTPAERAEVDFKALASNVRAVAHMDIGPQKADVAFTRSAAFLVFRGLPDFSHLKALVPEPDFAVRSVFAVSSEEKICIVRVSGRELASILALSTLSAPDKPAEENRGVPKDMMPIGEKTLQDVEELKTKLRAWEVEYTAPGFDIGRFIRSIAVCREFDNGRHSKCYVAAMQDDSVYSISHDAPWKRLQKGVQEFQLPKDSRPLCWLSDKGRLYIIQEERFVGASD